MFNELDKQLRDLEARLHEARHLLSAVSTGRAEGQLPGGAYEVAALLLTAKSASEAGERLCQTLRAAALTSVPLARGHAFNDAMPPRPRPLVPASAARRFEESDAPPRNP